MIINVILNLFVSILGFIFQIFPVVTLEDLPVFGTFLRSNLINIMGIWNSFLDTFPYGLVAWHVFLYIILPFEFVLLLMKFFLGHRVPTNHAN